MEHDETMILSHESRISKVETTVNDHEETLKALTTSLTSLTSSFSQVKNWIIGGVAFYVAHEVGFLEFVKGLF